MPTPTRPVRPDNLIGFVRVVGGTLCFGAGLTLAYRSQRVCDRAELIGFVLTGIGLASLLGPW
jgi:hypothetical protein